ncbi:hypothetical protein [Wolbachia endosymbiont of Wuchereria bancrofti]|uniref:hypothetical protein n=1 Tax=Wolbachia endosymbiont of Wuchereria bancrofti TaxID=96496 RepID=UPI000B4CEB90|nr:hypothetical protein [Wolbachia endosymbiont of Wuchereria bancrofti]OWZ25294.1 hypothetical protein CCY16_00291 [Wolbachia endosymbiont of Wuchereria bancrofti]
MKNGLPKHMEYEGNALPENTEAKTDSCSINYIKTMVVPDRIVLYMQDSEKQSASQDDTGQTQFKENYMNLMRSLPEYIDACGNLLLPLQSKLTDMELEFERYAGYKPSPLSLMNISSY